MDDQIYNVTALHGMDQELRPLSIPLYECPVRAGFPSPADGLEEARLQPNDYLVNNETATYFARVRGESMQLARIYDGDILVVDRSLQAQVGNIIVAEIDGAFTVKRLGKDRLIAEHPTMKPLLFKDYERIEYFGTVVGLMRKFL